MKRKKDLKKDLKSKIFIIITLVLCVFSFNFGLAKEVASKDCDKRWLAQTKDLERFCKKNKPYQDIVINGETVYTSWNSEYCKKRYKILKKIIASEISDVFKKHTLLDLGAAQGYFSYRLASELPIEPTMLENARDAFLNNNKVEEVFSFLKKLKELNSQVKCDLVPASVSVSELKILGSKKHFDFVVAMCIVHYLENWKEIIDAIIDVAQVAVIEIPVPSKENPNGINNGKKVPEIRKYIESRGGILLKRISRFYQNQTSEFYVFRKGHVKSGLKNLIRKKLCARRLCKGNIYQRRVLRTNMCRKPLLSLVFPKIKSTRKCNVATCCLK